MASFELRNFSVFQEYLFLNGVVEDEWGVKGVAVVFGEGDKVPAELSPADRPAAAWMSAVVRLDPARRAALTGLTLEVTREDGTVATLADLRDKKLGQESFWNVANQFVDEIRSQPSGTLLEIGSRARSGITRTEYVPPGWDYVGLDIVEGPNVDVVGDAHELTTLFPGPPRFDAVMAFAVLEHLLMPWKMVLELNRVLRPGAVGLFVTHQAWPVHEMPWDFYRFSEWAWHGLLNKATGFEIVESKCKEPAFLVAETWHPVVDHQRHYSYQSSTVVFRKVGETSLEWPVPLAEISQTMYPH